ncbi:GMC oxidoreductase-domain-containing protein [Truncatella angustata]|uniref:GMC oxidoreductase-domain-containing protein n=1 Tax=Truncatella angustata TaxID=152316 RepID=A0A9P8UPI5_9PEZI|nr:GMC oxidoreductase-domain-containing protein [Truncatella angustata]KAH6655835.1 GMC oxidoreductase-domain-containing protein [Truncatella angustata]
MYSPKSAQLFTLLGFLALSQGLLLDPATLQQNLLASYDYVIVGAGPAGLVVANRLTQDANINVLVLEAGPMDSREASITIPSNIGVEVGGQYDWNLTTVAQTSLDGTTRPLSQGHGVAGGTLLNGMIWTRGTQADYDAWVTLGNDGWGWADMVPYFKRVEAFTNNLMSGEGLEVTLSPDSSIYGTSGPVQIGYSEYLYSQFNNFIEGNVALGLDLANDTSAGDTNIGATIPPASISATNQSRCDARAAYLDDAIGRTNLHIAPLQRVTQLILNQADTSSDPIAEGVQFVSATDTSQVRSINATREVILASGAIWTPTLLQVSGIGPSAVLEGLGIETVVDLPGVGNNLQDHGMLQPRYNYADAFTAKNLTGATLQTATDDYYNNRTGPLTATLIQSIAYLPLWLLSPSWESLISDLTSADPNTYLPADTPEAVRTGYAAQYTALVQSLGSSTEGVVEIMSNSIGTIQVTSQRPLSRGYVRPVSASILDGVELNPNYGANPFDKDLIVMGLEWNARLIQTDAMQELSPSPDASLTSGDLAQLEGVVNSGLGTEYHPCGTTAMLPLDSGGVVDTELKVYGVQRLRSVNSGIIPLIPSAHIQAVTYALAEKVSQLLHC